MLLLSLLLMLSPNGVSALPEVISLLQCYIFLSHPAHCWGDYFMKTSWSDFIKQCFATFCVLAPFASAAVKKVWKPDLLYEEEKWLCTLHRVFKKIKEKREETEGYWNK